MSAAAAAADRKEKSIAALHAQGKQWEEGKEERLLLLPLLPQPLLPLLVQPSLGQPQAPLTMA